MKARQLIRSAMFGPSAPAAIGAAFEQAWAEVEAHFDTDLSREAARLILAGAILASASDESRDVDELKQAGLHALALRHGPLLGETAQHRTIQKLLVENRLTIERSREHLISLHGSIRRAAEALARSCALLDGKSAPGRPPQPPTT